MSKKRALLSVSDKTGLLDFAKGLVAAGYELISTGGTATFLKDAGLEVLDVASVTGFPEILEGRVKTLHPAIHGGLLAKRDSDLHREQVSQNQIDYIDLVCVNLYPFEETVKKPGVTEAEVIENIDIGGPSMLRSAAKNHQDVTVVCDVADYPAILAELAENGQVSAATRRRLAIKVYHRTAAYDAAIARYFDQVDHLVPDILTLSYKLEDSLRYGENPHQKAWHYVSDQAESYTLQSATQLHGKQMSYNNLQDASAALDILNEFQGQTACVVLKHMNPCGVALGASVKEAFDKAYEADPVSIFGGIVAINGVVDLATAERLHAIFLEIILAEGYEAEALDLLKKKKNLRLYQIPQGGNLAQAQIKSVRGGLLIQDANQALAEDWRQVTHLAPSEDQKADLEFGLKIVKHVKSNAIVVAKNGQTLGIGAGQMNRVGAAKLALEQAGDKAKGAVLASDAFFPMPDSLEIAADYGISAVVQPGGSIKDQASIDVANEKGVAMVFTTTRHFKH